MPLAACFFRRGCLGEEARPEAPRDCRNASRTLTEPVVAKTKSSSSPPSVPIPAMYSFTENHQKKKSMDFFSAFFQFSPRRHILLAASHSHVQLLQGLCNLGFGKVAVRRGSRCAPLRRIVARRVGSRLKVRRAHQHVPTVPARRAA